MSRRGHIAVRSCMGCGSRGEQRELIRVVRKESGELAVDEQRDAGGRGGYLHRNQRCWQTFSRRRGMVRSFRTPVGSQARVALLDELTAGTGL